MASLAASEEAMPTARVTPVPRDAESELMPTDALPIPDVAMPANMPFACLGVGFAMHVLLERFAVPGLVPDDVFFDHLANRRFPAGQFIRKRNELDYLQEPDVFHDVFGHVPMLTNPVFADYMEAYGKGGLRSLYYAALKNLAALYWYTVEFGLIRTDEGLRIYGAGIVSSKTESIFALEDPSPNRIGFDLERLMRTDYRIDDFQQTYFVIDSYDQLFRATVDTDFAPIYERLQGKFAHGPEDVLDSDEVITRGTQAYAKAGGRFADAS